MLRFSILAAFLVTVTGLLPHSLFAQTITGTVTSASSHQAIPFVNLGLPRRGLGTVSDEQGRYQLPYNAAYATDTVRVSSVGFRPLLLPFAALLAAPAISLTPEEVQLNEVSVTAAGAYQRLHTVGPDKPARAFVSTWPPTSWALRLARWCTCRGAPRWCSACTLPWPKTRRAPSPSA
ncbi:carboxypeptidase-like regulatory domain-containing protein [Hymenobacter humi]|uniref:Carboxypeptidase-like regulatory domain-containing protein n=1 Tax=Hymenobacter humi TaxID=1411620 RepID=A0ABW2U682_9BACT